MLDLGPSILKQHHHSGHHYDNVELKRDKVHYAIYGI